MKLYNILLSSLLLLSLSPAAPAQQRQCGAMEHLQYLQSQDPGLIERMKAIERHTERALASPQRLVDGVITIPVVVHVVYNNATENISDAQVQTQITVLNEDFRRMNSDANNIWPQAADPEIEFCLATVDPAGNPTTGITRTQTSVTSFGSSGNPVKFNSSGGHNAWPADEYLNIWVCDLSGGLLGYAQFPGGPASTDGIVVDYAYFGTIGTATPPFHLGRTATHEVGHWLNLRHIWGDGGCGVDDFVSDTPLSDAPNFGCPIGHISCGSVDMVQNYMDYTDDGCMNLYTQGQKSRMRAIFEPGGARASILTSGACGSSPPNPSCNDGIQNGNETGIDCGGTDCPPCPCANENIVTLTIRFDNNPGQTRWQIVDAGGGIVASGGPYATSAPGSTFTEDICLPDGCYGFTIFDSGNNGLCCSFGFGSFSLTDANGNSLAAGGRFGSSLTFNFCLSGATANCNDGVQNGNETGVDCGGPDCPACPGCNDGIQNGNETGVDCGGPDCPACPSCNDGVQNGNETGVDCGGPDCPPCAVPTCSDGVQNGNETGVDCGGPDCPACPGCNDGVQNGNETGVDCGGPDCPACPSCNDGVQNGNETGVDCGGPDCPACPSCNDGVQNGNETGVDCGGPDCPACPSCNDGVQNGNETGVDCGGPDCPPCTPGVCSYSTFNSNDFESGLGIWIDGGDDCMWGNRYFTFANSGFFSVMLRDNTSSSVMTTGNLDFSTVQEITVDFSYIAVYFSNASDDFWLQVSTNGGSTYTTVEEWNLGDEFQNQVREFESVAIPGPFSANTRLRFRCDATDDYDLVFIDDVVISTCVNSARTGRASAATLQPGEAIADVALFPNPVDKQFTLSFMLAEEAEVEIAATDITGKSVLLRRSRSMAGRQEMKLDSEALAPGVYFIHLTANGQRLSRKFVVAR